MRRAECEYTNIHPPITVLVTALHIMLGLLPSPYINWKKIENSYYECLSDWICPIR